MQEKIKIASWETLNSSQKKASMKLIDEKIPSLGKYTTIFLQKALDKKFNRINAEKNIALVALEKEKVIGIVVARKDLNRKQLWIRFVAGKYSRGVVDYVKKNKNTPIVSMIKKIIRRAEKERFETMPQTPQTKSGKAMLVKRIQKILPKTKRTFRLH